MTLIDWCLHASGPAREIFAAGVRRASLLRQWEISFYRRLLRAVEDHPSLGDTPKTLETPLESNPDRCVIGIPNETRDGMACQAKDEPCRPARASRKTEGRSPGVLIADDEEAICFSLARELRRQGIVPFVAADGPTALKLFQEHEDVIDAVFLDVRMPRLDGPGTLAAMRRIDPALRCCLMTAFNETALQDEKGAPAVELLKKPFDLDAFLGVTAHLLGRRSA